MKNLTACGMVCAWIALGTTNAVLGQAYLHQLFVLNEGWSNWQTGEVMQPATMGVYTPGLQTYQVVDTLDEAGFVSDAVLVDQQLYVAADGQLLKYDANTYEVLATAAVIGIRQIEVLGDRVYVTRGEVDAMGMNLPLDSYFQWYDAESLMWLGELDAEAGPQFATEGLVVEGEALYIGINNAFDWGNEVGKLGRYNPITDLYEEWDLGVEAKNPNRMFASAGVIVTVNNGDYASTTLSQFVIDTESASTVLVSEANAGCLAASAHEGVLRYQVTGENQVRQSTMNNLADSEPWLEEAPAYYGMAVDPVSGNWFGSVTDYSTFGYVEIRESSGMVLEQFDCGVSPGVLCPDVRNASSIATLAVESIGANSAIEVDALGRAVNFSRTTGVHIDAFGIKRLKGN